MVLDVAGCSQVRGLFAPLSCAHFTAEYWERRHHLVRSAGVAKMAAAPIGFAEILSSADLQKMAVHWEFKVGKDHSQARMLRPNSFGHNEEWADGTRVDIAVIKAAHRTNHTVVLHNLELYWRPIGRLSLALQMHFGLYSQANVYYSPAGVIAAVHAHQDAQSVFVIQCEGYKRWQLFSPPQRWRLRLNQRGKGGDVAPENELESTLDNVTLGPDDVLFVPRGVYHRTSTSDSPVPSLHITFGVETDTDEWTWIALLLDACEVLRLANAKEKLQAAQWRDERLREALPLQLTRQAANMGAIAHGTMWLSYARELLRDSLGIPAPASKSLSNALESALHRRYDLVDRKRQQLIEFMRLSQAPVSQRNG